MIAAPSRAWPATVLVVLVGVLGGVVVANGATPDDAGSLVTGPLRFLAALFVAAIVLTSLHEAAHATVGRLVGWEVFGVTIGHGRRLASLHLGSVRLDLRGTLVGGTTIANAPGQRWRDIVMLAAGVSVESVVIVAALWWQPDAAWGHHVKWAVVLVACMDIALNLWPRRIDVGPVTGMATDGAQLLSVITTPEQWHHDLEQMRLTPVRARLVQTLHGGDIAQATNLARAAAAADPSDDTTQSLLGTLLLLDGQWREAFDQLAPLAEVPDADPMLANNAAWAAVMTFDPSLLPSADRFSVRALADRPTEPACANTRGSTLVLCGRAAEGLPLLQLAASGRISRKQKAFVLAFTALAWHRLGNAEEARRHLSTSNALDRDCPAGSRVKRLMLEPPPMPRPTTPPAWPPPRPPSG